MQNAKDTFYEVLRGRLSALNPERTISLRGATRPGVLVEENELVESQVAADCFRLEWTAIAVNAASVLPMASMHCEVRYATAGTALGGGMDRGRALAAMDAELRLALSTAPQSAPKQSYAALAQGGSATAMQTRIWWGDPEFGATVSDGERLERAVTVEVMGLEEAGEM